MKALFGKTTLLVSIFFMISLIIGLSYAQQAEVSEEEYAQQADFSEEEFVKMEKKLAKMINSQETKELLAGDISAEFDIDVRPQDIVFDPDTLVVDPFRYDLELVCVTVDFTDTATDELGVASFLYSFESAPPPTLIRRFFWYVGTEVSESIYSDTTWDINGSPYYVTTDLYVDSGATLTINPGVEVLFRKKRDCDIYVNGTLVAQGTGDNPIRFTSSCRLERLDEYQLDDWFSRDWGEIHLEDGTSGSVIEYANIEYSLYGVYLDDVVQASIANNVMFRCYYGAYIQNGSGYATDIGIENNDMRKCRYGVYVYYGSPAISITGNTMVGSDIEYSYAGISTYYNYDLEGGGAKISRNTIRDFSSHGISCYSSSPDITRNIISGNYYGIYIHSHSSDRYSAPFIRGNRIVDNSYGISFHGYSYPAVVKNWIENNSNYGVYLSYLEGEYSPLINLNDIQGNGSYGVYNSDSDIMLNAENNYWGSADGPSGSGPGSGDAVNDYVDYDPFRTSPVH